MKHKPPIRIFWEPIDRTALAVMAIRRWDFPSNGVFKLFRWDEIAGPKKIDRTTVEWEMQKMLDEKERHLFRHYGRAWRYHATEYVDPDTLQPDGSAEIR